MPADHEDEEDSFRWLMEVVMLLERYAETESQSEVFLHSPFSSEGRRCMMVRPSLS